MTLHIANTFFEYELEQGSLLPLQNAFEKHEIFLQLQFLPFLYGGPKDGVLVTDSPPDEYFDDLKKMGIKPPKCEVLANPHPYNKIKSWGASRSIAAWAEKNKMAYAMPPWEIVCKVNAKVFSFEHGPKLLGAEILSSQKEAEHWIQSQKRPFVLKTSLGVSGRGHLIADPHILNRTLIDRFLEKEWKENRSVVAEPWEERILDFSTQWEISSPKEISYLGATICENDSLGRHKGNKVGNEEVLFQNRLAFLQEHKDIAQPVLQEMANMGYFGNVGVDAMIYKKEKPTLHPIVEINARKTMGWLALELVRYFPDKSILLSYTGRNKKGLLPMQLLRKDKSVLTFSKQLEITVL